MREPTEKYPFLHSVGKTLYLITDWELPGRRLGAGKLVPFCFNGLWKYFDL